MLSYQHGYHAGGLADVHKHALLAWMLDYLTAKPKPLSYLETHAGRGLYRLDAPEALRTGEGARGIGRAERWFAPGHPYARALAAVRASEGPAAYPGSPRVAAALLRPGDRIWLAERHPAEFGGLRAAMAGTGAQVLAEDGPAMALARTPPEPRRGLVLIDPSYEVKSDYAATALLVGKLRLRWNVGVIAVWYPILAAGLHEGLTAPGAFRHEVRFAGEKGLLGSGMLVVNPPWGLEDEAVRLGARFAALA